MFLDGHKTHKLLTDNFPFHQLHKFHNSNILELPLQLPFDALDSAVGLPDSNSLGHRHLALGLGHDVEFGDALVVLHDQQSLPEPELLLSLQLVGVLLRLQLLLDGHLAQAVSHDGFAFPILEAGGEAV